jgi:hypothetical protein
MRSFPRRNRILKQGIRRIDRSTVSDIAPEVSATSAVRQSTYDNANGGLNPWASASDAMAFDLDPLFPDIGSAANQASPNPKGTSTSEQIYDGPSPPSTTPGRLTTRIHGRTPSGSGR